MKFTDRELQLLSDCVFHTFQYVVVNPHSELVGGNPTHPSNTDPEYGEVDFNYTTKEIDELYRKVAYRHGFLSI